jgi:hypothetical protein
MTELDLTLNAGLSSSSRLRHFHGQRESMRAWEWAILGGIGVLAAASTTFLDFGLRVPGHAILRAIFPMAMGLALVPRRGAGIAMGAVAMGALGLFWLLPGWKGPGVGASVSLLATGPMLDLVVRRELAGRRLYLAFALAGCFSNILALFARGATKWLQADALSARPFAVWAPEAVVTYLLCGLIAGAVSGAIWFCAHPPTDNPTEWAQP